MQKSWCFFLKMWPDARKGMSDVKTGQGPFIPIAVSYSRLKRVVNLFDKLNNLGQRTGFPIEELLASSAIRSSRRFEVGGQHSTDYYFLFPPGTPPRSFSL